METLDNRETAEPTGSDPPGESISTRASACESAFVKGLCLLDSNQDDRLYATALRKLQKRFTNWTGYLGVFAGGNGSLDQRLKRHPQHGDLVVVALNMLKDNLLQVTAEPSDQGSDDSSDEETERRQIELEGIRMSINELDRLAILIRQSSTSSLDARVKAFASKRAAEVSSFETKAILAVNALYPDANESLCQRLSKSMVHRYTKLLYWQSHDRKLRADYRRPRHSRELHIERTPSLLPLRAAPQNQIAKSESDTRPEPVTRAGSAGISLLSETIASDPVSRFSLLPKPMEPVKQRAGATTVLETGALFPKPPKFDDGDETAPCPLCRKVFQRHDFTNDVWWKSHVNEDLVPFVCVATSCLESSNFTRRSEWRAHIEQDHGVVWQQNPGIALHDENKAHSPDSQGACENVTICPLCCSSPLEEPRQLRARNPPTSSESPKALQAGSKEAPVGAFGKKTVRFDVPKQGDSPTALPATSRLGMKPAKHMTMANHIAGHLQFLALLTPRLSTKSLTDEEDIDFASSQALSGDSNSGERSTLGDELELEEGQNTQNLEIRASSSETNPVPVPEESIAPQDEDIPPTEPMDWALFSPLDPTHEGNEDTIPKHIKESLLKDAASRFARADLPTEAIEAAETLATLLRQGDPCTNFGSLIQFDKDLTRESLYRFFNTSLSSVDDGDSLRTNIYHYLVLNADGNFLWVSMACRDLEHTPPEDILESLSLLPPGLSSLYDSIYNGITSLIHGHKYRGLLATVAVAYGHQTVVELMTLVGYHLPDGYDIKKIITSEGGFFLSIRGETVSLIHKSARNYIYNKLGSSEIAFQHERIFRASLASLFKVLHRDMYGLDFQEQSYSPSRRPNPDPLAPVQYAAIYWINHFVAHSQSEEKANPEPFTRALRFLRTVGLYWLEAQILIQGSVNISGLESLIELPAPQSPFLNDLKDLAQDLIRLATVFKPAFQVSPMQLYASALVFSPIESPVMHYFKGDAPDWLPWHTIVNSYLDSSECTVLELAPDASLLAAVSGDSVNLWDMSILEIISRFKVEGVSSFAFFHQRLLAFGTRAGKVSIRDIATGKMSLEILRNGGSGVASLAFSSDGDLLVLVTFTGTIEIWDLPSRTLRQCFQSTKRLTSRSLNNRIASLFMTDPGALSIDSPELVNMARAALKVDHHVGFELSDDGDWITKDGKQVLWLPPEFQASCSAVAGNVVVISCQSGLSRFEFE